MRGYFVTGTDTGVGKTVVAGGLAAAFRRRGVDVGVMKPIETGASPGDPGLVAKDARYLREAASSDDPDELVCPYRFATPLSPLAAAREEGREIDTNEILRCFQMLCGRNECVIVEGAGGLAVPILPDYSMRELARDLDLPLLIVARPGLGTINHTVLTIQSARVAGLAVAGIVINGYPSDPGPVERTNPGILTEMTGVPMLAILPVIPGPGQPHEQLAEYFNRLAERISTGR